MTYTMPSPTTVSEAFPLTIRHPDGRITTSTLLQDSSLIIGSGTSCGLCLPDDQLSPMHCLLRSHQGEIWILDWYSTTGTFVDGQRITAEVRVGVESEIGVGQYVIRIASRSAGAVAKLIPAIGEDGRPDGVALQEEPVAEPRQPAAMAATLTPRPMGSASPEAGTSASPPAPPVSRDRLPATRDNRDAGDAATRETVELLRSEVERLEYELAERDAQLAELDALANQQGSAFADPAESTDVEKLVTRLEELLDELQRSDERHSQMEELLRAAEETNRARQDEWRELESWVGDVEQRVGQREAEWQAENELLQRRLDEVRGEREQLERRLTESVASNNLEALHESELERLRAENSQLNETLVQTERDTLRLQEELKRSRDDEERRGTQEDVGLREERVRLAQERAELARQRAELAATRAVTERAPPNNNNNNNNCDIDNRLRAFREHLREIHDEERQERQERNDRSLAVRLGRLWKRLER